MDTVGYDWRAALQPAVQIGADKQISRCTAARQPQAL